MRDGTSVRLFLAVAPPAPVIAALEALDRPALTGVRWTLPAQWHVTLRFLGEVSSDDVGTLVDEVRAATLPSDVTATPAAATDCFRREVLHVLVNGMVELAGALTEASARFGAPPERRRYRGHVTLARARRGGADLRALAGQPVALPPWSVDDVELVQSELGKGGSRYSVVERFSLPR